VFLTGAAWAGAGLAALAALATGAAACTSAPPVPPPPDRLLPLLDAALSDAQLATAVAQVHPKLAAAASVTAADRTAHAQRLAQEIHRADPSARPPVPGLTPAPGASTSASAAAAPPAVPPDPNAAATALATMLQASQAAAADLVATLPGYRAGLVGSMAACCASHVVIFQ
jgi:hypothetical protein